MLSPQELEALWKYPQVRQYHAAAAWSPFARIDTVRYRPGQALRRTQEPRGLRRQGTARKLRRCPSAIRGVRRAHGCGQSLDRRDLLDAQQRLAVAALASVRLFPRIRPAPTSAPRKPTSRCTSSTRTTRARSCWSITRSSASTACRRASACTTWTAACAIERRLRGIDLAGNSARQVGDAAGADRLVAHVLHRARARLRRRPSDQPQRLLAVHPDRRARLGAFELVPDASRPIRGPDRVAVVADRDQRGQGDVAAQRSRGDRHGHARGTRFLHDRGAVPAPVDRALRGGRLALPILWSDNDVTLVARRVAQLDRAFRRARRRGAGRRGDRMERSQPERPDCRRESDRCFAEKSH